VDETQARLTKCFSAVFPDISYQHIASASQDTVNGWDSTAAATLVAVIEEEFSIEFDIDELSSLTSFELMLNYLTRAQKSKRAIE
jgi:acyl carrier protein